MNKAKFLIVGMLFSVFCLTVSEILAAEFTLLPNKSKLGVQETLQMVFGTKLSDGVYRITTRPGNAAVRWRSSDPSIAAVDRHGKVTGIGVGDVEITAEANRQKATYRSNISVVNIAVAGLKVPEDLVIHQYCKRNIEAQPLARDGSELNDRLVYWVNQSDQVLSLRIKEPSPIQSEKPSWDQHRIASVKGIRAGDARIAASCEGVTKTMKVRVLPGDATAVQVQPSSVTLTVGQSYQLRAVAANAECAIPNMDFTWSSVDEAIATVDGAGMVTAKALGSTQVVARAENGISGQGTIAVICEAGLANCSGKCVDLSRDTQNCGNCGIIVPDECCYGRATNTNNDDENCSRCGHRCADEGRNRSCVGGECVCSTGTDKCGSDCVDLGSDEAHCGLCDRACSSDQICIGGVCKCTWREATMCDNKCVDLKSDIYNCGGCGNTCGENAYCINGACARR